MNKLNLNVAKHSSNLKYLKNIDIYIVDTFGETKKFLKFLILFLWAELCKQRRTKPT